MIRARRSTRRERLRNQIESMARGQNGPNGQQGQNGQNGNAGNRSGQQFNPGQLNRNGQNGGNNQPGQQGSANGQQQAGNRQGGGGGQQGGNQGGNQGANRGGGNRNGYGNAGDTRVGGGGNNGTLYGDYDTGGNTPTARGQQQAAPRDASGNPADSERSFDQEMRDLRQLRQMVGDDPEAAKASGSDDASDAGSRSQPLPGQSPDG